VWKKRKRYREIEAMCEHIGRCRPDQLELDPSISTPRFISISVISVGVYECPGFVVA